MSENRDLEKKILQALQRHQTKNIHKSRLIFSIIAGLVVTIVLSQIKISPSLKMSRSSQKTYYTFYFPMSVCGDISAGGENIWYPVYIDYSESNLRQIRKFYCCDAEYDPLSDQIIVASFYNRAKADQFVATLRAKNFRTAYVGTGQRITSYRTNNHNNCK